MAPEGQRDPAGPWFQPLWSSLSLIWSLFLVLFYFTRGVKTRLNKTGAWSFAAGLRGAGPSVVWIAELWHVSVPLTVKGQVLQSPRFSFSSVNPPLTDDPRQGCLTDFSRTFVSVAAEQARQGDLPVFLCQGPWEANQSSIHLYLILNLTSFPTK